MWRVALRDSARITRRPQHHFGATRLAASKSGKLSQMDTVDGCTAVAHVSYGMSDTAMIFPITPSSPIAELAEQWSTLGVKNVFGDTCKVTQLQSEAGAAGALHGALCAGSLATTFTASQGFLLMIPNMYKIAGELLPCVVHVASRAIASQGLSIFGDNQDVMAGRQTGFAFLGADDVQSCGDMALASHLATLDSRIPFVHFFDGFRVSHTIEKIHQVEYSQMRKLMNYDALAEHHARALSPMHPHQRGTNQNPDVYMQILEASNPYYDAVPDVVNKTFDNMKRVIGREYKIMEYYGAEDAEQVVVVMGSGVRVFREALDFLEQRGDKVGILYPRLYRPWSAKDFLDALPASTKQITVLDRTKEPGSFGEPLYLDVAATIQSDPARRHIDISKGRFGLGQKEFTPGMCVSIIDELKRSDGKSTYTVGIEDDVTNLSLAAIPEPKVMPEGTVECMIYGFGSDGTVGANKNAIKIIGDNTNLYAQGYFAYGASKAGGLTMSHLRFGPEKITSYYNILNSDYVAVHNPIYVDMYRVASNLKDGGKFVLNSPWTTVELMDQYLPSSLRKELALKNADLYNIDAFKHADAIGMGRMINTIMQAAFFRLSGVLPYEEAVALFKDAIKKSYGSKGKSVVEKNWAMVDAAVDNLHKVEIPAYWSTLPDEPLDVEGKLFKAGNPAFVNDIQGPMALLKGDDIKVSTFKDQVIGGVVPMGTAAYEKRGVALEIPEVDMDKCTQCNYCSYACPHAVIRPFLLDQKEFDMKPPTFDARKARGGAEVAGLNFRIQVSAMDCTGCAVCVNTCPDDALRMVNLADHQKDMNENWDFAINLPNRNERFDKFSVKGSQFQQPLLEFHGACAGCGETPYVKLLTQLFGERMIVANATGCSSIWGGPFGANPYTTLQDGRGAAWGNSLFEDGAEYGLGMAITMANRRKALRDRVHELLLDGADAPVTKELYSQLREWSDNFDNWKVCNQLAMTLPPLLQAEKDKDHLIAQIAGQTDMIPKLSMWTIGGDGWAYDIGFGGVDHVLASGENVNILVLDTEVYSNTGGQSSKSTPLGAIAKFAQNGRETNKKDMVEMAISYGNVYVANVSMGASMQQTMKAFMEGEAHNGPSLLVAYSPCIEHKNIDGMANTMMHMANAANSGYFPLFRYVPQLKREGKNPFLLDTKKLTCDIDEVLVNENRFAALKRKNPQRYETVSHALRNHIINRWNTMKERAAGMAELSIGRPLTILYGSETGTTEAVAYRLADECKARQYAVKVMEMDEVDLDELPEHKNILMLCATCGEGDTPKNAATFMEQLTKKDAYPEDHLKGVEFAVFGMGDSSYHEFNEAAKIIDQRMGALGATRLQEVGMGDDQHEDKFETALEDWWPDFLKVQNAPEPEGADKIPEPAFNVQPLDPEESMEAPYLPIQPPNTKVINLTKADRLTDKDFDRQIQHLVFDIEGKEIPYLLGDVLNVYPKNDSERVGSFLEWYGLDGAQHVKVTPNKIVDARRAQSYRRPMPQSQIFEEVVDILGRPNKFFYKELAKFATDPAQKAELTLIASDDGKAEYSKLVEETVTYDDVLRKFDSAKPPVDQLISLIPCIKPRLYSIASSPRYDRNVAELAIVILEWQTPSGKTRTGLGTDYVRRLKAGDDVVCSITSGTFNFPEDPMTPMIMAGLGTGLAPFRAFAQEQAWKQQQGIATGPMWLFYGCRYKSKDYIFGDELEQWAKDDVITELHPAFSRDQKHKIYVQNRIEEQADNVAKDLIDNKGYFYLCGQAGQVELDIKNAIYEAIAKHGKMSKEEGQAKFEELSAEGRYCPELY